LFWALFCLFFKAHKIAVKARAVKQVGRERETERDRERSLSELSVQGSFFWLAGCKDCRWVVGVHNKSVGSSV
jgi:hypothetical protein